MRRRTHKSMGAAAAALMLMLAPLASAATSTAAYQQIYGEWIQRGSIDLCSHTEALLQQAQREAPVSIAQTQPAFATALQNAIAQRPAANCTGTTGASGSAAVQPHPAGPTGTTAGAGGAAAPTATTPAQTPTTTAPPATATTPIVAATRKTTSSGGGIGDIPLIALAVVLALIALAAFWWLLVSLRTEQPRWLLEWRHALAEARFRLGGTLADFGDWLRLGR